MQPPPYPADTRAKGWRFELDPERIRQSDTWALTPPELRPWLLMLWMTAWEQTPCGSLPKDDELIAARIDMPIKAFAKARCKLLRGWVEADDGRLYHPVIAERVKEMIARRDREAARKKNYRSAAAGVPPPGAGVPLMSRGTGAGQTPDCHGTDSGVQQEGQHQNQIPVPVEKIDTPVGVSVHDKSRTTTPNELDDGPDDCPHQEIIAAYHRELPMLRKVAIWNDQRQKFLRSRWREDKRRQSVEWWGRLFRYIATKCPTLIGQHDSKSHPGWQADLEWIVRPTNFAKVIEGKYEAAVQEASHAA